MSDTIETAEAPADDLRSVLSAAFEGTQEATEQPPRTDRVRDEHGRFARAEPQHDAAEPAGTTEHTDQPAPTTDEPENQAIDPPASWSDAEKAHWASLTREAQETVIRRERDFDKGLADRATELQSVAPLREVLAPYQSKHAMMGLSDAEAVRRLLAAQEMLEKDPDRAFPELARAFGYDLGRLTGQQPTQQVNPQQQQFRDPRVDRMLADMERSQHTQAQAAVEAFSKDPAHSHFADVRDHMGLLLQSGGAKDLKDAYDKAVWAIPTVREKVLAERERTAQMQRDTDAKRKAEEARRASVSVRDHASASGGTPVQEAASLREEIARAWGS